MCAVRRPRLDAVLSPRRLTLRVSRATAQLTVGSFSNDSRSAPGAADDRTSAISDAVSEHYNERAAGNVWTPTSNEVALEAERRPMQGVH